MKLPMTLYQLEALKQAAADFEFIRETLVSCLNEPERTAFWKAVSARDRCREALTASPGEQKPVAAAGWDRAAEIVRLIDDLRSGEGDSVTILCDNPDFNGQPNCAVICNADWTGWQDRRFAADTILDALCMASTEKQLPSARPVIAESNGHHWVQRFNLTCCRDCGIVRRADDSNSPCNGVVGVSLRREAPAPEGVDRPDAGGGVRSFSDALGCIKRGAPMRRLAWKPNKFVRVRTPDDGSLDYLELAYVDGRRSPWTPTRCDLMENDWCEFGSALSIPPAAAESNGSVEARLREEFLAWIDRRIEITTGQQRNAYASRNDVIGSRHHAAQCELWTVRAKFEALSAVGDEAKKSEGVPGKQSASVAAAAPIETEDAEVAIRLSDAKLVPIGWLLT